MTTVTRRNVLKGGTAVVGGMAGILAAGRRPPLRKPPTVHWLRWTDFVPASRSASAQRNRQGGREGARHKAQYRDHQRQRHPGPRHLGDPVGVQALDIVCVLNN